MCLDGSPALVYYSKGWGDGVNKTVVHFGGGGWCYGFSPENVTLDCYYRSQTDLGTSINTNEVSYDGNSYSGDIKDDMNFYNWNRYGFYYCDGSGHQGYLEKPINVKNS
jgi:hypothetical protein